MGSAKPCLGYPSRTAAVLALRGEGLSTSAIARQVGVNPSTVTALEASSTRTRTPMAAVPRATDRLSAGTYQIGIDADVIRALRAPAAARSMSVHRLVHELLEVIARDRMVDAVLDDAREDPR